MKHASVIKNVSFSSNLSAIKGGRQAKKKNNESTNQSTQQAAMTI